MATQSPSTFIPFSDPALQVYEPTVLLPPQGFGTSNVTVVQVDQRSFTIKNIDNIVNNPGGNTSDVQFNAGGTFTGDAGFTYDPETDSLTVYGDIFTGAVWTDSLRHANGDPWTNNMGTSGYSGSNGIDGASGFSGSNGTNGASGFSGSNGAAGASGYSGSNGIDGASGFSGKSGVNGAAGFSGYSGIAGSVGTTGASGFSGTNGASGFSGTNGASGFSGTNGAAGTSGFSGFGTSGFSGISGAAGVGGVNTQVQYNNSSTLAGASGLTYNSATNITSANNLHVTAFSETVSGGGGSGVITPDMNSATVYKYTLTGNITINTLANAVAGSSALIVLAQDGTGGHTLSSSMLFAGGLKTLSTDPGAVDTLCVIYDGSTYYASLVLGYA